jgi:hypothetical protein
VSDKTDRAPGYMLDVAHSSIYSVHTIKQGLPVKKLDIVFAPRERQL